MTSRSIPAFLFLTIAMTFAAGAAPDDALTRPRLEAMLEQGDDAWIMATFARYPAGVLPFFDGYLEEGLALIEAGGEPKSAHALFRIAGQFAALASETFEEPLFETYATNFASWSPAEQTQFRAGQAAYKAGRSAETPAEAVPHLTRSFRLAQPLGDAWGMAMAAAGLARAHGELGESQTSWHYHGIAADLYERLRMTDALIAVHMTQVGFITEGDPAGGHRRLAMLARTWRLVRNQHDHPRRAEIAQAYIATVREQRPSEVGKIEAETARMHR